MSVALSGMEKLFPMAQPLTTQPVLELIFAIFLPSLSAAILFNIGASGGGTDILAMILKKLYQLQYRFCPVCGGSSDHCGSLLRL